MIVIMSNRPVFCTGAAKAGASNRDGSNGAAALLPALGAQKIGNTFVHLRKIAQHPLLVRSLYTESAVQEIAAVAHKRWVAHPAGLINKQPASFPPLDLVPAPMRIVNDPFHTTRSTAECPHLIFQCRGDFGGQATLAQVQAELSGYSDHQLHAFCSVSRNKRLQELVLPADKVCACLHAVSEQLAVCGGAAAATSAALSTSSLWALIYMRC